jgi:hypothetical protein
MLVALYVILVFETSTVVQHVQVFGLYTVFCSCINYSVAVSVDWKRLGKDTDIFYFRICVELLKITGMEHS